MTEAVKLSKAARRRRNAAARREAEQHSAATPPEVLGIEQVRAASAAAMVAASTLTLETSSRASGGLVQGPAVACAPVGNSVDSPASRPRRVVCPECYATIPARSRDARCTACRERLGRRSHRRGRPTDSEITERVAGER